MTLAAFNLVRWIDEHRHILRPPVGNAQLFEASGDFIVFVVGGPNARSDYHDDPFDELFYQLQGTMVLKVIEDGDFRDIPVAAGEMLLLPAHMRHSPQRPEEGSVGLVIEKKRPPGSLDGFEWYCPECAALVHRLEAHVADIVADLPPLFDRFYNDKAARICPDCGAGHPGRIA